MRTKLWYAMYSASMASASKLAGLRGRVETTRRVEESITRRIRRPSVAIRPADTYRGSRAANSATRASCWRRNVTVCC